MNTHDSAYDPQAKAKIKLLQGSQGIAYVEAGSGDALVFVHGSLCDYRYWRPQLQALSAHYRVIAPSLSHYYPVLPSSVGQPFSWLAHAAQLARFLRRLGAGRIHLVGHSRGAAVAYQVALRNPGLLTSLVLIDPAGPQQNEDVDNAAAAAARATRLQAAQLIETGEVDAGLKLFVDSTSQAGLWDRSAAVFQGMARDNAGTLAPQMADPLPAYRATEADGIVCPSLLIQGGRSPAIYRRNADLLMQWLPQASSATIAGASHGMTWSHPQAFNRQLRTFLDSLPGASPPG